MRKIFFLICLGITLIGNSQNTVNFSYDNAGNNILRSIQITQIGSRINAFTGETNNEIAAKDSTYQFRVFPNPTSTNINIDGPLPNNVKEANVTLLNSSGQIVKKDLYQGNLKTLSVNEFSEGLYILQIEYGKKKQTSYKIIINK